MRKFPKTLITSLVTTLLLSSQVYAEDDEDLGNISLEDLINIKVTVASGSKGMTIRESPGIVTLITSTEISNSGARDLIDVLNLVPGFTFGVDVQGVVGISARGNWSHEGKISLMVDDMEMNELSFATLQFGNHFPVSNIERIELIRGPGSAIYGGFAEMGVIKIITKNAETLKNTEGSVLVGKMEDGGSRASGSLALGKKFDNGSFSANMFYTQGQRSDREFSDFYEEDNDYHTYNMDGNSDLDSVMLNVGYKYKELSLRYLHDKYNVQQRDVFFVNAPEPIEEYFRSDFFDVKYDFKIGEKLTLTPQVTLKKQKPWNSTSQLVRELDAEESGNYSGQFFEDKLQRLSTKIIGSYDFSEDNNLIFGVSRFEDEDKTIDLKYDSLALFAQSVVKTSLGTITTGARWEDNSVVGSTFLPRLGYTNVWDKTHLKVLWSKAFRAPVIQNIEDFYDPSGESTSIKPENTTVFEIEAGYQLSNNLMITANIYDILIEDPIVYFYDAIEEDSYRNYEKVGTRGFELEARYNDSWGYVNTNYSNYQVSDNLVDQYATQDIENNFINEDQLHGTPSDKFSLNASFNLNDNWKLNSSVIFEGSKYAYIGADEDDQLVAEKQDSVTLLNMNAIRKNLLSKNLDLQVGIFNLLNEDVNYTQPYYDGYHAQLPGPSREMFIRLNFRF